MYTKVINPITRKKVSINSKEGSQILKSYLRHINGHNRKLKFGGSSLSLENIKDDIFFKEFDDCRDVIKYCSSSKTTCKEDTYKILLNKFFPNIVPPPLIYKKSRTMCSEGKPNCENFYNLCYLKNNITKIPITPNEELRQGIIRAALFPPMNDIPKDLIELSTLLSSTKDYMYTFMEDDKIFKFMEDNIANVLYVRIQIETLKCGDYYTPDIIRPIDIYRKLEKTTEVQSINGRINGVNTFNGFISANIPITMNLRKNQYSNVYTLLTIDKTDKATDIIIREKHIVYVPHKWYNINNAIRS